MKTVKKQTTQESKEKQHDQRTQACLEMLHELKKKSVSEVIHRELDSTSLLSVAACFLVECMMLAHEWTEIPYEDFYDDTLSAVHEYAKLRIGMPNR